jgi:hypothetical protein
MLLPLLSIPEGVGVAVPDADALAWPSLSVIVEVEGLLAKLARGPKWVSFNSRDAICQPSQFNRHDALRAVEDLEASALESPKGKRPVKTNRAHTLGEFPGHFDADQEGSGSRKRGFLGAKQMVKCNVAAVGWARGMIGATTERKCENESRRRQVVCRWLVLGEVVSKVQFCWLGGLLGPWDGMQLRRREVGTRRADSK